MMNEEEIKEKFVELFERVSKEKDLKKREKIALEIRNFAIKVEEEKKAKKLEFKSEILNESLDFFKDTGMASSKSIVDGWLWTLRND